MYHEKLIEKNISFAKIVVMYYQARNVVLRYKTNKQRETNKKICTTFQRTNDNASKTCYRDNKK